MQGSSLAKQLIWFVLKENCFFWIRFNKKLNMLTSMVKEHHKEQVKRKQEQGMDFMQFSCLYL